MALVWKMEGGASFIVDWIWVKFFGSIFAIGFLNRNPGCYRRGSIESTLSGLGSRQKWWNFVKSSLRTSIDKSCSVQATSQPEQWPPNWSIFVKIDRKSLEAITIVPWLDWQAISLEWYNNGKSSMANNEHHLIANNPFCLVVFFFVDLRRKGYDFVTSNGTVKHSAAAGNNTLIISGLFICFVSFRFVSFNWRFILIHPHMTRTMLRVRDEHSIFFCWYFVVSQFAYST